MGDQARPEHADADHIEDARDSGLRNLLVGCDLLDRPQPLAAVFARPGHSRQPCLGQLALPGAPGVDVRPVLRGALARRRFGCLVATAIFAPSAGAASVGGCQLQGTANFSPGLGASSQPFSYSFGGNLTGCQSSQSGVPTTGTVSAGQTLSEQVHNSVTG